MDRPSQQSPTRPAPSRRDILTGISLLALGPMTGLAPMPALAAEDADFIAVSRSLVGDHPMTPAYSAALLAALRKAVPGFDMNLATLRQRIGEGPVDGATLQARLAGAEEPVAKLPQTILTGWYLGVAGAGESAICVAYVDAFANQEVADVLRPPSYAYGAYGSWAQPPV